MQVDEDVGNPRGWLLVSTDHSVVGQLYWCFSARHAPR